MISPEARKARAGLMALTLLAPAVLAILLLAAALLGRLGPETDLPALSADLWRARQAPEVTAAFQLAVALVIVPYALVVMAPFLRRPPLHGAARWARRAELKRGGLLARRGLILGRTGRGPGAEDLIHDGPEHVLVSAPTRSGKGVSLVIPNLLTWPGSAVVLDIKRENHAATAGWRAKGGQTIHLFDPLALDGRTSRFNPLGHVDRTDAIAVIDELQRLAALLLPLSETSEPFWSEAARTAFIGVGGLIAADPAHDFAIGPIHQALTLASARPALLDRLKALEAQGLRPAPAAVLALKDICAASDNTFASVRQTLSARLGLWLNPRVDAATRCSDFTLETLLNGRTTLYLAASPESLPRLAPLYSLIFQQLIDQVARRPPGASAPLLLLLDEFTRLGAMPALADAFAWIAGYGVRLMPVIQSPAQLHHIYGASGARSILANCGVEVVFAPRDIAEAEGLSARLGSQTWPVDSQSRPLGLAPGHPSRTRSLQRRPLRLPQELITLDPDALIVLKSGLAPVLGRKLRFYQDRRLRRRILPPPELPPPVTLPPCPAPAIQPEPDPLDTAEALDRIARSLSRRPR